MRLKLHQSSRFGKCHARVARSPIRHRSFRTHQACTPLAGPRSLTTPRFCSTSVLLQSSHCDCNNFHSDCSTPRIFCRAQMKMTETLIDKQLGACVRRKWNLIFCFGRHLAHLGAPVTEHPSKSRVFYPRRERSIRRFYNNGMTPLR